jgi:Ribonuclease G/E
MNKTNNLISKQENICPHCGGEGVVKGETSLEMARRIHSYISSTFASSGPSPIEGKMEKMIDMYEEAIIDAVEDENRRIVRLLIDIDTPADISSVKWGEIKNIIIPKI